jgi:SAM-dependent methyltransferase
MCKEVAPISPQNSQLEQVAQMPLTDIPSGVTIPETITFRYIKPRAWVLNYGCGQKQKHIDLTEIGLDINGDAVLSVKNRGINSLAYQSDVTRFEIPKLNIANLAIVENIDVVIMEALLCNLTGREVNGTMDWNDWKRALQSAHIALAPGGYLIIGDMLRADQENPVLEKQLGRDQTIAWKNQWISRYKENQKLGLPFGEFAVAKPGLYKDQYDFGSAKELKKMQEDNHFERKARHFTMSQIAQCTSNLGFSIAYQEYAVFKSRNDHPLSGFFLVLQKQNRYQYHYRYHGLTEEEADVVKERDEPFDLEQSLINMLGRVPEPEYYFPSLSHFLQHVVSEVV